MVIAVTVLRGKVTDFSPIERRFKLGKVFRLRVGGKFSRRRKLCRLCGMYQRLVSAVSMRRGKPVNEILVLADNEVSTSSLSECRGTPCLTEMFTTAGFATLIAVEFPVSRGRKSAPAVRRI